MNRAYAVSYTHLDVYKRQGIYVTGSCCWPRFTNFTIVRGESVTLNLLCAAARLIVSDWLEGYESFVREVGGRDSCSGLENS